MPPHAIIAGGAVKAKRGRWAFVETNGKNGFVRSGDLCREKSTPPNAKTTVHIGMIVAPAKVDCYQWRRERGASEIRRILIHNSEKAVWRHNDCGMALFKARKYADALRRFRLATQLDPTPPLGANNLGYTYYKLEQYEEAARWFEKTLALDPRRAVAYLKLGATYAKLGRNADAKGAFEK